MRDHAQHQRLQHAGIAPTAVPVDADNTPSQFTQQFVDMSTPSPTSRHVRQHPGAGRLNPQRAMPHRPPPPGVPSKTTGFVDMTNQQFVTVHASSGNSRRRRPNVEALMRSSIMSGTASLSSSQIKSIGMPPANADVVSVPILGDCAFEQKYSIRFSQDHDTAILQDTMTPIARLTMLRDAMGSISKPNGYIDRATFSQAFEVQDNDFDGYNNDHGYVDGHAFLIDAVMELDVSAEEKLKFIFDTLDTERMGTISIEQVEKLLESNFSNAKLEIVGMDMKTVAALLFRKANAREGCMNYTQFRSVFQGYVTGSFGLDKANDMTSNKSVRPQVSRSKFSQWYGNNKIRIWWLVIYAIANNLAFWLKWHAYKVDPALGYGLRIARGCAQVAMLNVMLLFMPMLRSITQVMKRSRLLWRYIPFDDHIEAHKICGSVCLIAGIIHTLAHVSNEIHLYLIATPDEISRSVFVERKVKAFENGLPPFSVMLQAIPVWTGVILIVITAISFPLAAFPKLRGGNFNVFWYSHMLFGVFLLVLCFHGATSWLAHATSYWWVGPPFALYLIERRFRYAKMFAAPVRILEAVELEQTCAVFMEKPRRFVYRPGMYLFINCPTISTHEWHPFTISSAPGDNYVSIHMRKAGDWTGAFHKLIADCHANKKEYPNVYLDGPVGAPTQDYHRYSTVICVGGGIGVTPFASILKDVVHLWEEYRCRNCKHVRHPSSFKIQKLYFHWTTRAQESLMWFEKTMNQITAMDRDNIIEAHQYLTTVKEGDNTSQLKMFQQFVHDQTGRDIVSGLKSKMLTHFGRPDWDQVFQDARRAHPGEEIGVFFCGPHPLEKVLDEMCKKYSDPTPGGTIFDYHSEKFA